MNADQTGQEPPGEKLKQALIRVICLPLLLVMLAVAFPILLTFVLRDVLVTIAVWLSWLPRGKDTLVVYSNSPHWQVYFESIVTPSIAERCYVLSWSERKTWPVLDLRVIAFNCLAGDREYNPIVIVFKPFRRARAFSFYRAMRDVKHNNHAAVRETVKDLSDCLGQEVDPPEVRPRESA
ncbi:MAG: hypothetical protein AAF907_06745 [Planctomycetota bacterium]